MNRTFLTIDTDMPAGITKPYDIALTLVSRAETAVKRGHESGQPVAASFTAAGLLCAVFSTPSGQLRYQVGPIGKPYRNSAAMLGAVTAESQRKVEFEARGTRVPMVADVNYCEGHAPTVMLKGRVMLALPTDRGYSRYFHVGAMPRGQEGRREYAGPMVPGPWAFANGAATCITANRAIAERDAAERDAAIPVQDGTLLVIDNCQYRVEVVRGEWLTLHLEDDYSDKRVHG
jgi:hypothetical protein